MYSIDGVSWSNSVDDLAIGIHAVVVSNITNVADTYTNGTFGLSYTDSAGLAQTATITCQNFVITVT